MSTHEHKHVLKAIRMEEERRVRVFVCECGDVREEPESANDR